MTNYADSDLTDQDKTEKVKNSNTLDKPHTSKILQKKKDMPGAWSCFERTKEILQNRQFPISLKIQLFDQCVLPTMTYGCQIWSLDKQLAN